MAAITIQLRIALNLKMVAAGLPLSSGNRVRHNDNLARSLENLLATGPSSLYVLSMAANASVRAQRRAVLESPLRDFEGWLVAVDCGGPGCRRDRVYSLADLAGLYGGTVTVGEVVRRLRCQECGGRAQKATLRTGIAHRGMARSLELAP